MNKIICICAVSMIALSTWAQKGVTIDDALKKFEHRNFKNHGDGAEDYRKIMDGKQGWDFILNAYKTYCET